MINIVIPMAGAGSRFAAVGYQEPKPLIHINGIEMIRVVIKNLQPAARHRFTFVCQSAHVKNYDLRQKLSTWAPGCNVIEVQGLTQGAACTVLAARDEIDNDDMLLVVNSDQYVDTSIDDFVRVMEDSLEDGLIMTMNSSDPKWSYVSIDDHSLVNYVVEKQVISNEATVGIYGFRTGRLFVHAADEMIDKNFRVNDEFYVAPVYNSIIKNGGKIGVFNIGSEANGMYGLGTPADLELFLKNPIATKATAFE